MNVKSSSQNICLLVAFVAFFISNYLWDFFTRFFLSLQKQKEKLSWTADT